MRTPEPYEGDDDTAFSASRVREIIGEIAKEPHPVDTPAHERVRKYLCSQLASLGLQPVRGDPDSEDSYVVETNGCKNILAMLDGASDNAILLMAHYDSARNSYGAADDGYGIATILEILRAIKAQNVPLLNDIMILFTDAEELWMKGAKGEIKHHLDRYKNVLLVVNVEAYGIKGPPLMFETGDKNASVVSYYAKHARNPVAYSFTAAYYSFMRDDTDFAVFRNYGFDGLNFGVIDGFEYHHTPNDHPDNIDVRSLQHYGDQVFPIAKSFVSDPSVSSELFTSNTNKQFFTVFPGILVSYSETVSTVLAALAAVLSVALFVAGCRSRRIKPGKTFAYTGLLLTSVIGLSLASEGVVWLLSVPYGKRFKLVNMVDLPNDDLTYWLLNIAAAVLLGVICRRIAKRNQGPELLFAGILLNLVLSLLLILFLTNTSYIAILPALLASLYAATISLMENRASGAATLGLAVMLDMIIFVPIVTLVYQALSIGLTGAGVFFCLLPFTTILPMFYSGLK
ncbi:MAG: M28 family peptidase [Bacillota bacterium]